MGRSVGLKKKKKNHEKSRKRRLWSLWMTLKVHIYIFGLTKYIIYCRNVPVFLYAVTMVIFRIKELFQVKNGLITSLLFFFFENAKKLGRSDEAKRRKEDGFWKSGLI